MLSGLPAISTSFFNHIRAYRDEDEFSRDQSQTYSQIVRKWDWTTATSANKANHQAKQTAQGANTSRYQVRTSGRPNYRDQVDDYLNADC